MNQSVADVRGLQVRVGLHHPLGELKHRPMHPKQNDSVTTDSSKEADNPQIVAVRSIPFRTFVSLSTCIGFSFGAVIGVCVLIASPFGVLDFTLTKRLGGYALHGFDVGLLFLIVMPLYYAIVSLLLSIPGYIPFCLVVRLIRRLRFLVVVIPSHEK